MNQSTESLTQSTEVAIIGAGPIGLELAAALKDAGIQYLQFEARQIGHTMTWWPRNTYFFSTTERIEIAGIPVPSTTQGRITGEEYLAYLRGVVEQLDLPVNTYEPVVDLVVRPAGGRTEVQILSRRPRKSRLLRGLRRQCEPLQRARFRAAALEVL